MPFRGSHHDIHAFMRFYEIDDETAALLATFKGNIKLALPRALDRFYAKVQGTPEVSRFFSDAQQIDGAKKKQSVHWEAVGSAHFGDGFVEHAKKIAETHAKTGLAPHWYIGGYALIIESIVECLVDQIWPKFGFLGQAHSRQDVARALGAFVKSALLDMDFVISVYLDHVAAEARRKAEEDAADAVQAERQLVAQTIGAALQELANGNLACRIRDALPADYQKLSDDFNTSLAKLDSAVQRIQGNITTIRTGTQEIASASDDLSKRVETNATDVAQTKDKIQHLTAGLDKSQRHDVPQKEAETSVIGRAVMAISQIEDSSRQIARIVDVMDEMAFQTNLLALNAGVEAARAGDAGKGFAVVASEVRALAQRSADAAKEIRGLIAESEKFVSNGVKAISEAGSAMRDFTITIDKVEAATHQNAAAAKQSTEACFGLAEQTDDLQRLIAQFKTGVGRESSSSPLSSQVKVARSA